MCKNLLFYTVAGLLISLALGGLGVSTPLSMLAAILIPPGILLAWKIAQYKGIV